jgi:hypothetical protein
MKRKNEKPKKNEHTKSQYASDEMFLEALKKFLKDNDAMLTRLANK